MPRVTELALPRLQVFAFGGIFLGKLHPQLFPSPPWPWFGCVNKGVLKKNIFFPGCRGNIGARWVEL